MDIIFYNFFINIINQYIKFQYKSETRIERAVNVKEIILTNASYLKYFLYQDSAAYLEYDFEHKKMACKIGIRCDLKCELFKDTINQVFLIDRISNYF